MKIEEKENEIREKQNEIRQNSMKLLDEQLGEDRSLVVAHLKDEEVSLYNKKRRLDDEKVLLNNSVEDLRYDKHRLCIQVEITRAR